jgi:transposase
VDDADNELSGIMRQLLRGQYAHLLGIHDQLAELEVMLKSLVAEEESYKRLMEIPGVGLITATLLGSDLGNGSAFRNGRCFAASLGLVPRQYSSGGKNTLLGISKSGNRYLRTLLIHCARAVLRSFALGKNPFGEGALDQWVRNLLERRGKNKTAVALAAKLARVAWAMLAKGTNFQKAVNTA